MGLQRIFIKVTDVKVDVKWRRSKTSAFDSRIQSSFLPSFRKQWVAAAAAAAANSPRSAAAAVDGLRMHRLPAVRTDDGSVLRGRCYTYVLSSRDWVLSLGRSRWSGGKICYYGPVTTTKWVSAAAASHRKAFTPWQHACSEAFSPDSFSLFSDSTQCNLDSLINRCDSQDRKSVV